MMVTGRCAFQIHEILPHIDAVNRTSIEYHNLTKERMFHGF